MFRINLLITLILSLCFLTACHSSSNEKTISILLPIEHNALNEIVKGFQDTLHDKSATPLKIRVLNAQGDINLERAYLTQLKNDHTDIVVPVGTDASILAMNLIQHKPIISMAAEVTDATRKKQTPCHVSAIQDDIPSEKLLQFIHTAYPSLKEITLIHSASDKVFPEVAAAKKAAEAVGIHVTPLLVPTLNELYAIGKNLPKKTEAILILKDSLIASGISTLSNIAMKSQLPLITSDEGTIQGGGTFSIGVHERDIGVGGAELALEILNGKSACDLPIRTLTHLTVFINRDSLTKSGLNEAAIQSAARQFDYPVEIVKGT